MLFLVINFFSVKVGILNHSNETLLGSIVDHLNIVLEFDKQGWAVFTILRFGGFSAVFVLCAKF